jgi:dTDP-L-rhamnose 4-epimerase
VALRYFNIYGARQSLSNPYTGVAAIFLSRLLNGKPPIVFEDGRQSRDFIDVRDIARANVLALTTSGGDGRALNVGCATSVSVLDVYQELARVLGVSTPVEVVGKFRAGDIRHCFSDASAARLHLGWEPQVKFADGLADLVAWSRAGAVEARDLVDVAYAQLREKKLVQ